MEEFYQLTYADDGSCSLIVQDYNLDGFDYHSLLQCQRLDEELPPEAKIFVKGPHSDLIGGALPFFICSKKLCTHLENFYSKDFQKISAPLFNELGFKVDGFFIINPLKSFQCLNGSLSMFVGEGDEKSCLEHVINREMVSKDAGLFRIKESIFPIIFSKNLVSSLIGKGFRGIGFLPCCSV